MATPMTVRNSINAGLLFATVAMSVVILALPRAGVAAPGDPSMTLVSWNKNTGNIECYHEDSQLQSAYTGSLAPGQSFSVTLTFCTEVPGVSPGPGGEGFYMAVRSGRLDRVALTATSPTGQVYSAPVASVLGIGTQGSIESRVRGFPFGLEPGTWTITLANNDTRTASGLTLNVDVSMAYPQWQQSYFPRADWNFTPATILAPPTGATIQAGLVEVSGRPMALRCDAICWFWQWWGADLYVDDLGSVPVASTRVLGTDGIFRLQLNTSGYRRGSTHTLWVRDKSTNGDSTLSDPVIITITR